MKYTNIITGDTNNTLDGVGLTLFVSGCDHNCPGCQNKDNLNYQNGSFFGPTQKTELFDKLKYHDVFTVSGGDPLSPKNISDVSELVKEVKHKFPNIRLWCYTGYTIEELKASNSDVIAVFDVIVDGKFVQELRDETCVIFGSNNQRIYDVESGRFFKDVKEYFKMREEFIK